jgi:ABC-type Zn uptake system ZnuABC Zn-binding protein ZnuA
MTVARTIRPTSSAPRAGIAIGIIVLAGAVLAACGPSASSSAPGGGSASGGATVNVLTTTTVFADMVRNVGGSLVSVSSLVPKSGDVHTYEPKPADARAVARADLLVMNGLGLDDWLEKTITSAGTGAPLLKLAPGVDAPPLPGPASGTENPHLWMDVRYAQIYADEIATALGQVDPAHAATYLSQAAAYKALLETLDAWVRQQIASVPAGNRTIVTFHDAFPYFAREYGLTIVGVAVEAPGQDPSAGYTATLIQAIRANGVKAIFAENQFPTKLADELAAQTGTKVVSNLYDDSLGDPPVTSYEEVIRWDVGQIVAGLR